MPQPGRSTNTSPSALAPYWQTRDQRTCCLYLGNVPEVLARLPKESVHCCITSPPYWSLRSYLPDEDPLKRYEIGQEPSLDCGTQGQAQCGECFVCSMVNVFRAVWRVLRDDGTLWLNLGDKYEGQASGMPWRVALALQADGWVLRQDIIWAKPSPMPESVRNRCTKAHEYVFLLAKSTRYFYDSEAVKEVAEYGYRETRGEFRGTAYINQSARGQSNSEKYAGSNSVGGPNDNPSAGRNKRSVWTISSQGYEGAHFATFPPKLVEPMILAGTSERGCCAACGAPYVRLVERTKLTRERPNQYTKRKPGEEGIGSTCPNDTAGVDVRTIGWDPTCLCFTEEELEQASCLGAEPITPCTVLDPFIGSGTTACVAIKHGRNAIGVDLSEQYLSYNAIPRIEGVLESVPALAELLGRERSAVKIDVADML